MATERMWKITIVGGPENGNEYSFPADKTVLIGRSHYREVDTKKYAALQLDKEHTDVSGKHLELFVKDGEAFVRNVSERSVTLLNDEKVRLKECARVQVGDTITLGRTVRVRLDEIPVDPPRQEDPETGETRFFGPAALDFAPVVPEEEANPAPEIDSPSDGAEDLTVDELDSGYDPAPEPSEGSEGIPPAPVQTPSPPVVESTPSKENVRSSARPDVTSTEVSETGLPENLSSIQTAKKVELSPSGEPTRRFPSPITGLGPPIFIRQEKQDDAGATDFIPSVTDPPDQPSAPSSTDKFPTGDVTNIFGEGKPRGDGPSGPSDNEDVTRPFIPGDHPPDDDRPTPPPPPPEVLNEIIDAIDRKRRLRRVVMGVVVGLVFVGVGFWWYLTRPGGEAGLSYPEPIHEFGLRDESGELLLKVDYPWNKNADVSIAAGSNGVTVVSAMGRNRDVPYYLQLETHADPEELKIGLEESVARWFKRTEEAGNGFSFDERMKQEVESKFFEDVYPGSCQEESLYGVRFVQFEYKRTRGGDAQVWQGIGIYFRCGDTVYLLRREMPETFWARGGYYLKIDSNLAIYKRFTEAYWESPGLSSLQMTDATVDELIRSSRNSLGKNRPSEWISVRQAIDSVLVRSWDKNPDVRYRAMELLSQFREKLSVFYYQEYNAFQTAKDNRDEKKMGRILQDVKSIFSNRDERYFSLVGNGEVW